MKTPIHIQNRIKKLILLVNKNTKRVSLSLCTKEVNELREIYSINTVHTYLTAYVKAFKDSNLDKDLTGRLRIGKRSEKKRNKATTKNRFEKLKERKPINNYKGMIELSKELLKSDHYADMAIGLMLLTGRRSTEIMKTATFKRVGTDKDYISFKGQLKKKDKDFELQIIALGGTAAKCCAALNKLRKKVKTKKLSNAESKEKYQNVLRDKSCRYFYDFIGMSSPHNLRACYAVICSEMYKNERMLDNIFISSMLGHNPEDIDTANSYKKYYIKS